MDSTEIILAFTQITFPVLISVSGGLSLATNRNLRSTLVIWYQAVFSVVALLNIWAVVCSAIYSLVTQQPNEVIELFDIIILLMSNFVMTVLIFYIVLPVFWELSLARVHKK